MPQSELLEDVRTYCRIVTALARTIELQQEIDALYSATEAETIPLHERGGGTNKHESFRIIRCSAPPSAACEEIKMNETTSTQTRSEAPAHTAAQKALLICGIVSFPLYLVGHVLAGLQLEGYSHIDRMVSELSAVGAPSQPVAAAFATLYNALVIAFGIGVWGAAGKKRSLRLTAIALLASGVIGLSGWLAPMNPRGAERTATDVGHLVYAAAQVLSMVLFVGLGSGADGRWFRIYSILTIVAALASGAYTGTQASRVAAGLPTPWGGAIQRVSVYGPMLWMAVLAIVLLRAQKGQARPEQAVE